MTATDAGALDFDAIARRSRNADQGRILGFAMVALLALAWVTPFYYLAVSVFKTSAEYGQGQPLALPQSFAPFIDNVHEAWIKTRMGSGMFNSALYGLVGGSAAVFIAALACYGLTRIDFRGKGFWFMLIFSGTIFPLQMYLIPLFMAYNKLGLTNSRLGMILFYTAICIPFPVLVLQNHMAGLPREIDEAARIDGCSEFRIFRSIILPNCWGPMTALFLIQFTWIWNDLLFSMVLTTREDVRSLMNGLMVLQGSYAAETPNVVMTATLLASLPTLALFFVLRRHFMQGLRLQNL
ncbi:carbohydrate ABC transporter permease [Labrys monachus]|uniref:Multiple sugar transport system permease protein n=1 Tax=Labrys monachus TaxID=217067 RepID=A0ABU0FC01_9HYPH|nr:carbohydrate ABC transporter permease [Labrys monachus]MDQ0392076.1 multiple sugar transport system permease protein [Labrys monachus]